MTSTRTWRWRVSVETHKRYRKTFASTSTSTSTSSLRLMSAEGREEAGRTPATVIKMFVHKDWHLRCLMAMCVLTCVLSPVVTLFPYGTSAGDTANPSSTTASSGPVSVSPALVFYNNTYNHLYVSGLASTHHTSLQTIFVCYNLLCASRVSFSLFNNYIPPWIPKISVRRNLLHEQNCHYYGAQLECQLMKLNFCQSSS